MATVAQEQARVPFSDEKIAVDSAYGSSNQTVTNSTESEEASSTRITDESSGLQTAPSAEKQLTSNNETTASFLDDEAKQKIPAVPEPRVPSDTNTDYVQPGYRLQPPQSDKSGKGATSAPSRATTVSQPPSYVTAEALNAPEPVASAPVPEPPTYASDGVNAPERVLPVRTETIRTERTESSPRSYREYSFFYTTAWKPTHNTIVDNAEDEARYFVEVAEFTRGKPDVQLRDVKSSGSGIAAKREQLSIEEGKAGAVAAFAQFVHGTNDEMRLAIGSLEAPDSVRWVKMNRQNNKQPWGMVLGAAPDARGRRFEWRLSEGAKRSASGLNELDSPTSSVSEGANAPKVAAGVMQYVDTESGEVIATYTETKPGRSFKKRGRVRFRDNIAAKAAEVDKDIELLVLLSVAATNEKSRRRTWKKWALMGYDTQKK